MLSAKADDGDTSKTDKQSREEGESRVPFFAAESNAAITQDSRPTDTAHLSEKTIGYVKNTPLGQSSSIATRIVQSNTIRNELET